MTAKEKLRELVEEMTEDEATRWLGEIAPDECEPQRSWVARMISEITAKVPPGELDKLPPSDQVDAVVYGQSVQR